MRMEDFENTRSEITKEPLDESERGEWKIWLKAQHSKNKHPGIWSHHFTEEGETTETVRDFIFLGWKITADGDCCHEIKRYFHFGRKVMTNLDSVFKSRDIILPTKVHLVKAMVFLVVMYGCESWTIKKAEHQRIDAFELWCWRRLLRVPWSARRSNQISRKSVLNIHWKDCCWHWNSNTLATWCEELLLGKDPDAGKDWRQEEKGMVEDEMVGWHHRLNGHEFE